MSTTVGSIVGIKPEAESTGGHMIQVADFGGEPFEVWIRPDQVSELIKVLQVQAINRAMENVHTLPYPMLRAETVGVAHQGRAAELTISTTETGTFVLRAQDGVLHRLRSEIDRVLSYRAAPPGVQ